MAHSNADSSDLEKLQSALTEVVAKFGSVEDVLEAFGLASLPTAQRYGVLIGCIVFFCTVTAVVALLIFGGSFRRIMEQEQTGGTAVERDYKARQGRPLLLERLLDARERLLKNYPDRQERKGRATKLNTMLMSVPPPKDIPAVVDDAEAKRSVNKKQDRAEEMNGFKENFAWAYRKCQDQPGGEKKIDEETIYIA